jgi:hypothetical protein
MTHSSLFAKYASSARVEQEIRDVAAAFPSLSYKLETFCMSGYLVLLLFIIHAQTTPRVSVSRWCS